MKQEEQKSLDSKIAVSATPHDWWCIVQTRLPAASPTVLFPFLVFSSAFLPSDNWQFGCYPDIRLKTPSTPQVAAILSLPMWTRLKIGILQSHGTSCDLTWLSHLALQAPTARCLPRRWSSREGAKLPTVARHMGRLKCSRVHLSRAPIRILLWSYSCKRDINIK